MMQKQIFSIYPFKSPDQLAQLQKELSLPTFVIELLTDNVKMTHLRTYHTRAILILNFPLLNAQQNDYNISSIALIITKKEVKLVCPDSLIIPAYLLKLEHDSPIYFIYKFIVYLCELFESAIHTMKATRELIEDAIISAPSNPQIQQLFHLQKTNIKFQEAISGLTDIIHTINESKTELLWSDLSLDTFLDLKIDALQLEKNIMIQNNIMSSLLDTSSSILSNNLSKTMKTLTSITIVISVPTLITSFYGMNIPLPFQTHPLSLLIVSIISIITTASVVIYLYKKDLF